MSELVYGEDRERRIRTATRIVIGLGVLLALLGVYVLVVLLSRSTGGSLGPFLMLLLLPATALLALSAVTMRLLPRRDKRTRVAACATGAAVILCSVPLSVVWLGYVMPLLGIVLLLLALIPDEEAT